VGVESSLAFALMINFRPIATWVACLSLVGLFCLVALWKSMHGSPSCGCMGALQIPPERMFVLDTALLAGLLVDRPTREHRAMWKRGGVAASVSLAIAWVMIAALK